MKPHKHAELIKAWADGAEIEVKHPANGSWFDAKPPCWDTDYEYRIKPQLNPDLIIEMHITRFNSTMLYVDPNIRLTFDGETGKLKSAEVLK